ncbi:MAG: GAF domain-containing protein [Acidobacteria bacterium]|nr:GAF domain-containing protein [Acidobacteriota bacterium]
MVELIRTVGAYRCVGLYEVESDMIAVVARSGPAGPAHPRLPITQGLCGAAVRSSSVVVVGDVAKDPRYLTTLESTRSEIVVPIVPPATGAVLGVIDVESERPNAFTGDDQRFLESCTSVLGRHWE